MQINKFYFSNIFLMLALLVNSCGKADETFIGLLYGLAEIREENREEVIQSWFKKRENFPIIENNKVYYIYQNKKDIPVFLCGDMNKWKQGSDQMLRIIGTSYYYIEQAYSIDARVEYKFFIGGKYILDPLNEKTSAGGLGKNSLLLMPSYQFPTEVLINRFQTYTILDTLIFASKILSNKRTLFVYRHSDAENNSPLIVFNDGGEYLSLAQTNVVLDNLIEQKKIPPCYAVFVNPQNRMKEYWLNDDYLRMLFEEIIPQIKKSYNIKTDAKIFMGGVSLGGLISFYALKNYSSALDGVFGQSPSFWVDSLQIMRELESVDLSNKKLFYDYGVFEEDSFTPVMNIFLEQKTTSFQVEKYNEGHAWGNWKGHLDNALIYLMNERTDN